MKIELEEVNIILKIPAEAFALVVEGTILGKKGKPQKVEKKLNLEEIREARQAFVDNIGDDYDAKYVITEEGRRYLDSLQREEA